VKKIFDKLGWSGIILIVAFICIFIYGKTRHNTLLNKAAYTKGLSLGVQKGVRGSLYLYYSFELYNQTYKGNVTDEFCKKCAACCIAGDTVIVRYQKDNPANNDLVTILPEGASLETN